MKFLTLHIKNYGKLTNKKIQLEDGINIIYGENEAGKSTIHSFIRGLLFGSEKQRGRASKEDHYVKYQPWEQGGLYGGTMDIKYRNKDYRIYRDFSKDTRVYKVVDLATGREQSVEDRKGISFIEGLTEDIYSNTISIEQLKSKTNQGLAEEVKNHLANLSTSKSNQIHVSDAIIGLKSKKKQLDNGEIDSKLEDFEKRIQERELKEQKISILSEQINRLKDNLKKELNPLNKEDILKLEDYVDGFPGILEKYNQLQRIVHDKYQLEHGKRNYLFMAPGFVIFLLGFGMKQLVIVFIGIVIMCFVGVYLELTNRHRKQSIERLDPVIKEEEKAITQYASRLMKIEQVDGPAMNKLEKEILSLKEGLVRKREESRENIEKLRIDIEKLHWQLDQLDSIEDLDLELEESLKEVKVMKMKEEKEKQALKLAIETIQSLSVEIHDSLGQSINERISSIGMKLTKGRYSTVMVDENLNIKVAYEEEFIPLESLSAGTIEQIYLALRIAVSNILFPKEKLPVLLDDAFAYYDYDRLSKALEVLNKEERQILIFTCHRREEKILEKLNIPFHKIDLSKL